MTHESEPRSQAEVLANAVSPNPSEKFKPAREETFSLPGLDLEEAARILEGDWAMLRRVLISFHECFTVAPLQLADALDKGDWESARRLVHTLKGLSQSIGAQRLHLLAVRFEKQLVRQETDLFPEFLGTLTQVLTAIAQLPGGSIPESPVDANPEDSPDNQSRSRDLAEIADWLRKHRKVPLTLLERLSGDWGSPEACRLRDALLAEIGQFDYGRALETLNRLQGQFPAS